MGGQAQLAPGGWEVPEAKATSFEKLVLDDDEDIGILSTPGTGTGAGAGVGGDTTTTTTNNSSFKNPMGDFKLKSMKELDTIVNDILKPIIFPSKEKGKGKKKTEIGAKRAAFKCFKAALEGNMGKLEIKELEKLEASMKKILIEKKKQAANKETKAI